MALAGISVGPDAVALRGWCAFSEASNADLSWSWAWCCEMAVPQSCQATNSNMIAPRLRIQVKTVAHAGMVSPGEAPRRHSITVGVARSNRGNLKLLVRGGFDDRGRS